MATRTIKNPNGVDITLSSDQLSPYDLAVAEILLEFAKEQRSATVRFNPDEVARRLIAKGYNPETGERLQ